MTIDEIKYLAAKEMERDGHLSKGVRIELVAAVKNSNHLTVTMSISDYIRVAAELRRSGHIGCFQSKCCKCDPNKRVVIFNA